MSVSYAKSKMYNSSESASNTSTQNKNIGNRTNEGINNTTSNTSNNNQNFTDVSETKRRLIEMEARLNKKTEKSGKSKFIKFGDNEYMRLKILPEQTIEDEVTYNEGEQPVTKFKFYCQQIVDGVTSDLVQEWTASPLWAQTIIHQINRGVTVFDVVRHGVSKTATRYDIDPVV